MDFAYELGLIYRIYLCLDTSHSITMECVNGIRFLRGYSIFFNGSVKIGFKYLSFVEFL